jgi:hypothetical protein
MRAAAQQNLTCFRQQLERPADPLTQATPFKQPQRPYGGVAATRDIHFPKLPIIPLNYRTRARAPVMVALDVIVTFSWMAFLGYGLAALIFWIFRMLG